MVKALKGKRVLVTGGAGFIGSHIVDRLLAEGSEVTVLDNLSAGKIENISHCLNQIRFIRKDLRDLKAIPEALEGVELICHQAALRSVPKSVEIPYEFHDVNVTASLNLFLRARDLKIKRIVFASSSSVYGDTDKFPEKELTLPAPLSPYAATKLMGEYYAQVFVKLFGLEIISLRYFNVFGPRQSLENEYAVVVPKFISCLIKGENPPIYGDGRQARDFTYIDNVVDANILALSGKDMSGGVFNIAQGKVHSVNELLENLKRIMNSRIKPVYLPPRLGDVKKTHADIHKAEKLLGWKPKIEFYQGLEKTAEWFRKQ